MSLCNGFCIAAAVVAIADACAMPVTVLGNNVDIDSQSLNLLTVYTTLHRSACWTSQVILAHFRTSLCHSGGKLVIINLQKTPKDKKASLVIHARCDEVMQQLMSQMQLPIPSYTRHDSVLITHALKKGRVLQDGVQTISCTLRVQSTHGQKCPLPLVQQVDVDFQVHGIASLLGDVPGQCKVYVQVHCSPVLYTVSNTCYCVMPFDISGFQISLFLKLCHVDCRMPKPDLQCCGNSLLWW